MRSREFITEAKASVAKRKVESLLDRLSDEDLFLALDAIKDDLNESAKDYMDQKKQGKRVEGGTSDFIAYDDATQTAKRYRERPSGLEVTDAPYKAGPVVSQPKAEPKPEPKAEPKQKPEPKEDLEKFVSRLSKADKEKLAKLLQSEVKQRKTTPKQKSKPVKTEPKKKGGSGKYIASILLGLLIYGANQLPKPEPEQDFVRSFVHSDGATYSTLKAKNSSYNRNVIVYLGKREGRSGTSYSIYAFDLPTGKGRQIKPGFKTDFDSLGPAMTAFKSDIPLGDSYELLPGSTQWERYNRIMQKLTSDSIKRERTEEIVKELVRNDPNIVGYKLKNNVLYLSIKLNNNYGLEHNGFTDDNKKSIIRKTGVKKVEYELVK